MTSISAASSAFDLRRCDSALLAMVGCKPAKPEIEKKGSGDKQIRKHRQAGPPKNRQKPSKVSDFTYSKHGGTCKSTYRACRNHVCACQIMCAVIMLLAHSLPWYSRAKTSRPPWPKLQLRPVRNFEEACLPNAQAGS